MSSVIALSHTGSDFPPAICFTNHCQPLDGMGDWGGGSGNFLPGISRRRLTTLELLRKKLLDTFVFCRCLIDRKVGIDLPIRAIRRWVGSLTVNPETLGRRFSAPRVRRRTGPRSRGPGAARGGRPWGPARWGPRGGDGGGWRWMVVMVGGWMVMVGLGSGGGRTPLASSAYAVATVW